MKQGTVKTLGAVALGAAIAASAAGAASAAPVSNQIDTNGVLHGASRTLSGVTNSPGSGVDVKTPVKNRGNQVQGRQLLGGLATTPVGGLPLSS